VRGRARAIWIKTVHDELHLRHRGSAARLRLCTACS
jgi:hypothetical protein